MHYIACKMFCGWAIHAKNIQNIYSRTTIIGYAGIYTRIYINPNGAHDSIIERLYYKVKFIGGPLYNGRHGRNMHKGK